MALRRDDGLNGVSNGLDNYAWLQDAACRGEHAASFFPPTHFERKEVRLARERIAKSICRQCPVAAQCLDYAIRTREPHGVWGGLNEIERRQYVEQHAAS